MSKTNKSPQHGTTNDTPDTPESSSQADGTAADAPRGETQGEQASGPHSGNPATAGKTSAPVRSETSEKRDGRINPSATTEATEIDRGTTKGSSLSDTFGEAGDPHGRGNLEIPDQTVESSKSQHAVGNPSTDQPASTQRAEVSRRKREDEAA